MGLRTAWNAISDLLSGREVSRADPKVDSGGGLAVQGPMEPDARSEPTANQTSPSELAPATPKDGRGGLIDISGDIEGNSIELGDNITLTGTIKGQGNVIRIAGSRNPQTLSLNIYGHNNKVSIGAGSLLQNLRVEIGSGRWLCSRARLKIGKGFSTASQGRFILPNSGNIIEIGERCMFSSNIVVRGGEYPHLIFDKESGEYLDVSDGIFIGNHVWVGEGAFIGKSVSLPDDCIVGTRSVVTKRFDETHCVIAGNPARVVKRGVQWVANEFTLEEELPVAHKVFRDARMNRINRTERKRAKTQPALDTEKPSAPEGTN